ncbi:MAG TPA: 2-phosphosulfolactate phosphatase [Firmicutes bacterium]|nr:2-phosphosulfolactate phosphatase [Candidatus Fermentithermobacillaceae bacterium]
MLETPAPVVPGGLAGGAAVVIDVLRATSSISTAISSGCRGVIPAESKDEALALKKSHPEALLGGEIASKKIEGFDLGNSPADYSPEAVSGKEVIMSTSNGTKAVLAAQRGGAEPILIASFLNLSAVARRVWHEMSGRRKNLTVICSGSRGKPSLEDFACAGAITKAVIALAGKGQVSPDETAKKAVEVFESYRGNTLEILRASPHGQDLISLGFGEDLRRAAALDSLNVVPVFDGTAIVALSQR